MLKKISFALLLIAVSGCDNMDFARNHSGTEKAAPPTAAAEARNNSLKWAVINKSKVQATTHETLKKANPYPKEIDQDLEKASRERSLLQQQVYELDRTAQQKCITEAAKSATDQQPKLTNEMTAYGYRNAPAFRECLLNAQKDQLTADLKVKLKKFDELYTQRREHEEGLRKKAEEAIALAIPKYAEQNGYQLIISNQSNDLVYNHDKLVLDVTDDVIDYILKNQLEIKPDSTPQPVNKEGVKP